MIRSIHTLCLIFLVTTLSAGTVYEVNVGSNETIELGNLQGGQELVVTLRMTNSGEEDFEIRHISSSCGCTTPRNGVDAIPAGETIDLDVTFRAPAHRGVKTSRIVFLAASGDFDPWVVSLHANISMLIELEPSRLNFGTLSLSDAASAESETVEIHNNSEEPITLVGIESDNGGISTRLIEPRVIAPDSFIAVEIDLAPPTAVGNVNTEILFRFEEEMIPDQRLRALAEIEGSVSASPSRVWFGSLRAGESREREVRITSSGDNGFNVTGATIDRPGFDTEITQPEPNTCEVEVSLDTTQPGVEVGPFVTELLLQTNDPHQPEVRLNVMGTIRP